MLIRTCMLNRSNAVSIFYHQHTSKALLLICHCLASVATGLCCTEEYKAFICVCSDFIFTFCIHFLKPFTSKPKSVIFDE